jgi:hypothetical protein
MLKKHFVLLILSIVIFLLISVFGCNEAELTNDIIWTNVKDYIKEKYKDEAFVAFPPLQESFINKIDAHTFRINAYYFVRETCCESDKISFTCKFNKKNEVLDFKDRYPLNSSNSTNQ